MRVPAHNGNGNGMGGGGPLATRLARPGRARPARTLAEYAYEALHEAILTGVLEPGERLPIKELTAGLRVSHMPVREALYRLHDAGLVELVPHRGARVAELSVRSLRDIYDARLALEPLAIARAAERFTPESEAEARAALGRHAAASEQGIVVEALAAHADFHFALYRPAGSAWLERLITMLWESSQGYRLALPARDWHDLPERLAEHERMLDSCVAHDPERAAAELHGHLARTAGEVAEQMLAS